MGYEYDVFLSYRRGFPVQSWLQLHFLGRFEYELGEALGAPAKVFLDERALEPHKSVPDDLRDSHSRSKVLVPVLNAHFFFSRYTQWELQAMQQREEQEGLRTPQCPDGTIVPVWIGDGSHFPPEVQQMVGAPSDFREYLRTDPAFERSRVFGDFVDKIRSFAKGVATAVVKAPTWKTWAVSAPPLIDVGSSSYGPWMHR